MSLVAKPASAAAAALACLLAVGAGAADPRPVARFRVAEGPDVAGEVMLWANGRFAYFLAAGALDERAEGRWLRDGARYCLTTEPKPAPPGFRAPEPAAADAPFLRVTWPNGRGIAGVDFAIGFDGGEPVSGYTQEDGWRLDPGEGRAPRWIELREPINGVASPRFPLAGAQPISVVLVPNDIGVVDFEHACIERARTGFVLRRREGDMRLARMNGRR